MIRPLVERAVQGDEDAFAGLVAAVGDRCMAVAFRILRDFDLAEDAVQTAFLKAWKELGSLRDPDRFEAWLHRLLVNACYAESNRHRKQSLKVVQAGPGPSASDDYLSVNDRDELERGFQKLPSDQRAVLVFRYYLGLTVPEVAEHLGIPVGTAKSRLHYASLALRAALEADARGRDDAQERRA